jgi:hypothetical protein
MPQNWGVLRFTQRTVSPRFSTEGAFAGRRISDIVNVLRSGVLTAEQIPVEFLLRNGQRLIVNTRSALALRRAGIPESQWRLIDRTGVPEVEALITERLWRNQLDTTGTDVLRITGAGMHASLLE